MKSFDKLFPFILIAGILINANGLLNDILEPDGALYATISKQMVLSGDWLNLYGDGHDWLDKPHFPFWAAALSFRLFGITAFAYKLPAFVFWLIGIWFTFKLTCVLYNHSAARVAVVIHIFSLHAILSNFDVRAEPYLTTLSLGAIYFFYKANFSGKWSDIVLTALLSACAVMTKGIFVLITISSGFIIYLVITKQWKQLIHPRWLIMILLVLLFITPELYSLYTQFDLHPEKTVFGKTNVSGLRFFFWDSQFGRFFNTGPIKGHGSPFFFLHTTLWAFLPWSVILFVAVFQLIKKRNKNYDSRRWIVYGSAFVTFLLFSFSGFQLPFYIVIIFPQFSIITANYLTSLSKVTAFKRIAFFQNALLIIAGWVVCGLAFYSHFGNFTIIIIISAIIIILNFLFSDKYSITGIVIPGAAFSLVLFIFLHNFFYPALLPYQSGMMAGKWLQNHKDYKTSGMFRSWSYSFEFYAAGTVQRLQTYADLNTFVEKDDNKAIYTTAAQLKELQQQGYQYKVLARFPDFHISMLTSSFLNFETRNNELEKKVLITIQKKKLL